MRREDATEESKPDSVSGDHLSARHAWAGHASSAASARPPIARGAPYPGLGEQRQRPCLGLQQGGLPFSLPPRSPKRPARAFVSVALAIGYPTPAYAGHLALRCLDFPLTPPKRCKRSPFLRRIESIPAGSVTEDRICGLAERRSLPYRERERAAPRSRRRRGWSRRPGVRALPLAVGTCQDFRASSN